MLKMKPGFCWEYLQIHYAAGEVLTELQGAFRSAGALASVEESRLTPFW
jgi:hypothetical protein